MNSSRQNYLSYFINLLLVLCIVISSSGCAAIIRGTSQTCRVVTDPPGQSIMYNGREVFDGESITIQKRFEPTLISTGSNSHVLQELKYDPDPLIICDAALLFLGVIPGVIALGVDFGTGAWRNHHNPQVLYVSTSVPNASSHEQVSVVCPSNEPEVGPPPWAPAHGHRAEYRYRYYPTASVYYDVNRRLYFYYSSGEWVTYATLPNWIHIDHGAYVSLEMKTAAPYKFHTEVVHRYPPGHAKKIVKGKGHVKIKVK